MPGLLLSMSSCSVNWNPAVARNASSAPWPQPFASPARFDLLCLPAIAGLTLQPKVRDYTPKGSMSQLTVPDAEPLPVYTVGKDNIQTDWQSISLSFQACGKWELSEGTRLVTATSNPTSVARRIWNQRSHPGKCSALFEKMGASGASRQTLTPGP